MLYLQVKLKEAYQICIYEKWRDCIDAVITDQIKMQYNRRKTDNLNMNREDSGRERLYRNNSKLNTNVNLVCGTCIRIVE